MTNPNYCKNMNNNQKMSLLSLSIHFPVRRTLKNGLSDEEKQHVATFIKSY